MPAEVPFPHLLYESIDRFSRLTPEQGVNNFVLRGLIDVPSEINTLVGVFPATSPLGEFYALIQLHKTQEIRTIYEKILSLDVPERVKLLPVEKDLELRTMMEAHVVKQSLPKIVLGFGESESEGKEVVILFSIVGIRPEDSLAQVQQWAKGRLRILQ
ncbi:MAG: hypothetical protein A3F04_02255 [Candidatus Chisholmbacteria bacterium RIFCSPHIGHO2_12_FULL_49_9]|uniref:Uncharacterized protein n=1 Tax=Candidatus Chisholmbacteria bacterium RIFCSPHIGHO2_01_FULL_52_32 TaxID=1797591 RepID=A0A1G1VRW4_9BACT|nr:MAG: hypothetical protein A2786_01315 [Candidatus Chisholmbacteria bacterium RIFCSPHIGHO2_01_FULL_52_32]OGY19258.1 MAG: hypothetical protein A3F04_02255 [Candidatus Chisholmbacteria bacterium RIFCSPHIGHO2_12_FULL_49_9]OGY20486.1 MAG: hypothetical protein A2900_05430 [Candidatus Chisholmbacteria bacterium RIFCSPLOWO2_01_FULL_50_28]